jgi:transposase
VADLRRVDRALVKNRARARTPWPRAARRSRRSLVISEVLAAKILSHTGDIGRFSSANCFASYSGTAPIEVSSGDVTRHRLSRNGNRSPNNALHLAACVQTTYPGPGPDQYERKLARALVVRAGRSGA